MHRILPLIGIVVISSAPSRAYGGVPTSLHPQEHPPITTQRSTRSVLARLPVEGRCTHADTVTTNASGTTTLHMSEFRSDSAGRVIMVIVDGTTGSALLAAYVGVHDGAASHVVGVLVSFSPRGKVVGADRIGQQQPFLVHDTTLAKILFREMKKRCGLNPN
jgi:hypothetical protein